MQRDNVTKISIHALREEGDPAVDVRHPAFLHISIHALREEGDLWKGVQSVTIEQFLSTPSARRATVFVFGCFVVSVISIHALREEGDPRFPAPRRSSTYFYPRPPRGGRPCNSFTVRRMYRISIHALREEGDVPGLTKM